MQALYKVRDGLNELKLYWNHPRPGEYVPYKEVIMLSIGWMALCMTATWGIGFGVGNEFTGMTLKMNNNQLLVMGYVCQAIGYAVTPLNAWIVDNLRSVHGKYRVYIKLAIPSMMLTLISLWLPYEGVRDYRQPHTQYVMILMLFFMGQIQGYVQGWLNTGVTNMVHVITPNTQERTKIMSITSIIYSMGYTLNNLYYPIMVDVLSENANKYNMRYYRGTYTPIAFIAPLVLVAYFGTKERLILPKSRITKMSFTNSLRAVAGNKIFWIKCIDSWNNFLEDAKGNIWDWMVYRAHIMKPSTYGVLNTVSHNASFWGILLSPWFIKKFGKRNIKIVKNIIQIFLIASIFTFYKNSFAAFGLFIVTTIDRFIDSYNVIDTAIESDMRDNQQYLIGERIDGAFGFISSYMSGIIGSFTGLFIPWVYKRKGFDGNDYSVLDVYTSYNEKLPLSQQTKNPDCVLYPLMDTLLVISVIGATIDVLPWFAYDITETGQKSMIRVVRLRTLIEDHYANDFEELSYIEGCEAVLRTREFAGKLKMEVPSKALIKEARALPRLTKEEKELRLTTIKNIRKSIQDAKDVNENIEIAEFTMHEIMRFKQDFGKQQKKLCEFIVSGGSQGFFEQAEKAVEMAIALPLSKVKEEKVWRKQEVRNARALLRSRKAAAKHYPNGLVEFDHQKIEDAYNMPDDTKEQAKLRRKAMRAASKEQNIYAMVAAPYLYAKRTLKLAEGYDDLDNIISKYDDVRRQRSEREEEEKQEIEKLNNERKLDKQRKLSQKKMGRL